jgi:hypothetical protein
VTGKWQWRRSPCAPFFVAIKEPHKPNIDSLKHVETMGVMYTLALSGAVQPRLVLITDSVDSFHYLGIVGISELCEPLISMHREGSQKEPEMPSATKMGWSQLELRIEDKSRGSMNF